MAWYISVTSLTPGVSAAIQAEVSPYYEGLTSLEMVRMTRQRLGVGPDDENRYDKASVVSALNQGGVIFAKRTGCIQVQAIIQVKANKQYYQLPWGILKILSARRYIGTNLTDYDELDILYSRKRMQRQDLEFRGTTGDALYLFPGYKAGNIVNVGISPIPTIDGDVLIGSPEGRLVSISKDSTGITLAGNITGTHKAGYPSSAFLVDAQGRDLAMEGALLDYPIINTTQNQSGTIATIENQDAVNDKITTTLSGGAVWQPGDAFEIPMGEFGTLNAGNPQGTAVDFYLGGVGEILVSFNNITMDVARKPVPFTVDDDIRQSELPVDYQEAQVLYATYSLGAGIFQGVAEPQKADMALAKFVSLIDDYNSKPQDLEVTENYIENEDWWG